MLIYIMHMLQIFVDEVMELVELGSIKNAIVGLPGVSGLSTEQRKRLTIAVELVANPSIIFMDEPTSGLDARAAAIVMRTVRNTVDTGRTVVCTIHQPSIDIFEAFDEVDLSITFPLLGNISLFPIQRLRCLATAAVAEKRRASYLLRTTWSAFLQARRVFRGASRLSLSPLFIIASIENPNGSH